MVGPGQSWSTGTCPVLWARGSQLDPAVEMAPSRSWEHWSRHAARGTGSGSAWDRAGEAPGGTWQGLHPSLSLASLSLGDRDNAGQKQGLGSL